MNCIRYNSDGILIEVDREGKKKYIIIYCSFVLMKRMIKWIYMMKKKFCDIYVNILYLKVMNIKGNKMILIKYVYND